MKEMIVAFTNDGKHLFWDGAKFVDDVNNAYEYNDHNDALSDWFDIDKRKYKRVFVCVKED